MFNSTAFEGEVDGQKTFIGSKTESALLLFAREHLAMGPVSEERDNARILQLIPFDSSRKCMGVVIALPNNRARLYVKGASEIVLAQCSQILRDPARDVLAAPLTDDNRTTIQQSPGYSDDPSSFFFVHPASKNAQHMQIHPQSIAAWNVISTVSLAGQHAPAAERRRLSASSAALPAVAPTGSKNVICLSYIDCLCLETILPYRPEALISKGIQYS